MRQGNVGAIGSAKPVNARARAAILAQRSFSLLLFCYIIGDKIRGKQGTESFYGPERLFTPK